MENRGLLFIPDISGFSRFVNETEIQHSRLIIQELLEVLINANRLDLRVSEIEGDAILFYKFGDAPAMENLYGQVARMFCDFHRHLISYEYRRFCQCEACQAAIGLTLKVITHYGEFTGYTIKSFDKLIGKDLVVAHRLLKNDIDQHEYWLVTNNLVPDECIAGLPDWITWNASSQNTESGEINFRYAALSRLKNDIPPESLPQLALSHKTKMISLTREYNTGIIKLFHATGDFAYRIRWQHGVKAVEEVNHFLPRVGMRCRCILENGQDIIYASSYSFHPERIEFSDTEEQKNTTTYYTLEKLAENKTRLCIDYYIPKGMLNESFFKWFGQKKKEAGLRQSLLNLDKLVTEIRLPGEA